MASLKKKNRHRQPLLPSPSPSKFKEAKNIKIQENYLLPSSPPSLCTSSDYKSGNLLHNKNFIAQRRMDHNMACQHVVIYERGNAKAVEDMIRT